ncbi:trichome birefringence-like protein 6, partial [Tanacetum coccineum]
TSGTCSFIDEGFNCEGNGRLDKDYINWRWKPHDCDIPRSKEGIRDTWPAYHQRQGKLLIKFLDYKCTVEYYVSHFLVHEGKARVGRKRMQTLRIDTVDRGSSRWRGADVLIFNTAHWWSHYKTKSRMAYVPSPDEMCHVYPLGL